MMWKRLPDKVSSAGSFRFAQEDLEDKYFQGFIHSRISNPDFTVHWVIPFTNPYLRIGILWDLYYHHLVPGLTSIPVSLVITKSLCFHPHVKALLDANPRILSSLNSFVGLKPNTALWQSLSHLKDAVKCSDKSAIGYKVKCSECPLTFVGNKTGRGLRARIDKHEKTVTNDDFKVSALAEHAWHSGHCIWRYTCLLSKTSSAILDWQKRQLAFVNKNNLWTETEEYCQTSMTQSSPLSNPV